MYFCCVQDPGLQLLAFHSINTRTNLFFWNMLRSSRWYSLDRVEVNQETSEYEYVDKPKRIDPLLVRCKEKVQCMLLKLPQDWGMNGCVSAESLGLIDFFWIF